MSARITAILCAIGILVAPGISADTLDDADKAFKNHDWLFAGRYYAQCVGQDPFPGADASKHGSAAFIWRQQSLADEYAGLEKQNYGDLKGAAEDYQEAVDDDSSNIAAARLLRAVLHRLSITKGKITPVKNPHLFAPFSPVGTWSVFDNQGNFVCNNKITPGGTHVYSKDQDLPSEAILYTDIRIAPCCTEQGIFKIERPDFSTRFCNGGYIPIDPANVSREVMHGYFSNANTIVFDTGWTFRRIIPSTPPVANVLGFQARQPLLPNAPPLLTPNLPAIGNGQQSVLMDKVRAAGRDGDECWPSMEQAIKDNDALTQKTASDRFRRDANIVRSCMPGLTGDNLAAAQNIASNLDSMSRGLNPLYGAF